MKTKLVLWAQTSKDEKALLAYQLRAEDNVVDLWTFSGENATNDVHRALMYEWREGKEMAFPTTGYKHHEMELSVSNSLLPEGFKAEKEELITRAQTEWHFVVLSAKLNHSYLSELEDLEEKVKVTESFQPGIWEELVGFWDKVQEQVRERNLSKDHANALRDKTNSLFSTLKGLRRKLDDEFKVQAKTVFEKFIGIIDNLDKKIDSGSNLASLFNELKDIQKECKEAKLTRDLRSKLWDRIDASFKIVKEKRFGPEGASGNSPLERVERRYQGLLKAIKRMEHSIQRDEKDLSFQRSKMNSFDAGQLETQLREAKIKVIQVQADSKNEKLADMHKTREQLEKQIEKEKAKSEKIKAAQKAKEEKAKKTAEEAPSDAQKPAESQKKDAGDKKDTAKKEEVVAKNKTDQKEPVEKKTKAPTKEKPAKAAKETAKPAAPATEQPADTTEKAETAKKTEVKKAAKKATVASVTKEAVEAETPKEEAKKVVKKAKKTKPAKEEVNEPDATKTEEPAVVEPTENAIEEIVELPTNTEEKTKQEEE